MIRLAVLVAAIVAAAIVLWPRPETPAPQPPRAHPRATPASAAPTTRAARPASLSPAAINQQDRLTAAEERAARRGHRDRRLIQRLPYVFDGVTVDVSGLDADGRTALTVVAGHRGTEHARAVYRRILRRVGDSGAAYRPIFRR